MSQPSTSTSPRLLIGLSGASATGKTTISRLLRDILPQARITILHQDDFFLPESRLPLIPDDGSGGGPLVDWDSAASLDLEGMAAAIRHLRDTGEVPAGFKSKEDRNAVGPSGVSTETIDQLRKEVAERFGATSSTPGPATSIPSGAAASGDASGNASTALSTEIFIIDGFLLFGTSTPAIRELLDLKLLLRARYGRAKQRRENRPGYATIEGFWTDPPGYWDRVVWPAYVREHAWLFVGGDVEGAVVEGVVERVGVKVVPGGGEADVEEALRWVLGEIEAFLLGGGKGYK